MTTTKTISLDSLSDLRLNKENRTLTLEFSAAPVSQESSVRKVGRSFIVTRNGEEMLLTDAVRQEFGIPKTVQTTQPPLTALFQNIKRRIMKGMSFEQAVDDYRSKADTTAHDLRDYLGIDQKLSYRSNNALAAVYNSVKHRMRLGMSFDEAIADYSIRNSATIERAKEACRAA